MTHLSNNFALELATPARVVVKVFTKLTPFKTGYLRFDEQAVYCVDPWLTAMKYLEHMTARGWKLHTATRLMHFTVENYVILALEKPLV